MICYICLTMISFLILIKLTSPEIGFFVLFYFLRQHFDFMHQKKKRKKRKRTNKTPQMYFKFFSSFSLLEKFVVLFDRKTYEMHEVHFESFLSFTDLKMQNFVVSIL